MEIPGWVPSLYSLLLGSNHVRENILPVGDFEKSLPNDGEWLKSVCARVINHGNSIRKVF